jgi:hypothetical protein
MMKLQHKNGDVIEVPPPDMSGRSVVRFNGRIVEQVVYSDEDGGSVTTRDGKRFTSDSWSKHIVEQLRVGAYKLALPEEGKEK